MANENTLAVPRSSEQRAAQSLKSLALFGPPPLIRGEKSADYQALSGNVLAAVQPRNFVETMLVRHTVDLQWDIGRLRRLKAQLLSAAAYEGLRQVLAPFADDDYAEELSQAWARRDAEKVAEVKEILKSGGLTMDAVMAATLVVKLDQIERIDRLIASAEGRFGNALREIDRRRAALGAAVRATLQDVQDAEYTNVETGQTTEPAH